MKFVAKLLLYFFISLIVPGISLGKDTTIDQNEVKNFVEKIYSYDPDTFSLGRFSEKEGSPFLLNRTSKSRGKFDPTRHCDFLRTFFEESAISKRNNRSGTTECDADYRYPNLDAENLSSATRYISIPKPKINTPEVNGSWAKVSVLTEGEEISLGRSLYFMRKTEVGWRITNVMIHTKWPDVDDGTHNCYYSFARKPSAEESKEIPLHCRR
ncbi:hypothetical protein GPA27_26360 [Aromatoleum toluolicum]|uniref:Uncharacterized protein n=1 Tax=Aromatoleum toluolicum TaxID=90060 RepID=A0ABX1NNT4_9RHOO|nr:hypothetical protein [Aromatoleum toluolicum]NMG00905.1 hypothetical protein [Aromatoleum toluolicum]